MTIEEKIFAVLKASAGVVALVPAARILPQGDWQQLPRPYIVHFPVAVETIPFHGGIANLKLWRAYQVSCFADNYASARAVADAVKAVLGSYRAGKIVSKWKSEFRSYEADTRINHIALDFEIADAL